MPPAGPGYPPQYPMSQDPNAQFYPPQGVDQAGFPQPPPGGVDPAGFPQQHPQQGYGAPPAQMEGEMNYYYGGSPGGPGGMPPPGGAPGYQPPYGAPGPPMNQMGHPYGNVPQQNMNPHWRDIQEEGAFGRLGGDQP